MKIAVIGGGTGGLVTAMVMCSRSPENLKIDLIHDPNSPIIGVGESLSHDFVQLLRGALQFQFPFDMKEVNATILPKNTSNNMEACTLPLQDKGEDHSSPKAKLINVKTMPAKNIW